MHPSSSAKSRPWLLTALFATVLFLSNIAVEVLGDEFKQFLAPYQRWVWTILGISLPVTIWLAIREARQIDDSPHAVPVPLPPAPPAVTHIHNYGQSATPPAPGAPLQLLAPPGDFIGRVAELAELREQVKQRGVTITGVRGAGGIGKTALALKLAAELKDEYPDGQIYLDLKGVALDERTGLRQESLAPAAVMRQVIGVWHPEAKLPDDEEALQRQYLGVLGGKRALLLFDNAKDMAQVAPLTPPSPCLMLVTSRQAVVLPGMHRLDLETLSPAEARELLLRIAPALGSYADRVAELCGQLPLALRAAASALAQSRSLTPERLVARLEKKRLEFKDETRHLSVATSLGLSYELLAEDKLPGLQQAWRALAVFPGSFDVVAAVAVWESSDEDAAAERLERLEQVSLLEWDADEARYRWHDLAREFANAQLSEAERITAQRRHAQYFCKVLDKADKLYLTKGQVMSGLALFDRERQNIETGLAWAEAHAATDGEADELCLAYPNAGYSILHLRHHPRERIRWLEIQLAAARRLQRRNHEGYALGNLGIAYRILGDTHKAIEFHQQSLDIAHETGNRGSEGSALNNLGTAYADSGETSKAIECYQQYLDIAREISDRRGEGNALGNLGIAYGDLGESSKAIEFYEQALVIDREIGDRQGEGTDLGNLSLSLDKLGDRAQAIACAEESLRIREEIGDPRAEQVRQKLAEWYKQQNKRWWRFWK